MPDIFDIAQENNLERNENLVASQLSQAKVLEATGFCLYCETPIAEDAVNKRFCNKVCRDDYDREQKLIKDGGG